MKKILILSLLSFIFSLLSAQTRLTAFPGAEGYGKFTTGGRGGNVFHVTRLDDCTDANLVEGTLRWALRTGDDTPRTIVFDTCGTIVLSTKLKLDHPNVTLAGQTAPGGGICIAGACIYVCKPNVIIRYLRFRPGDVIANNYQCLDVENTRNVIIDHCSLTWAVEECLTMYDCDSTTVQWSIIGEALYNAGHKKGQRSYAAQWGGENGTMHHCLITNCNNRTPRFNGVRDEADLKNGHHYHDAQVVSEFANNVVFNWGKKNSLYGGEYDSTRNLSAEGCQLGYDHIYMVSNYFRPGPCTTTNVGGPLALRFVEPSNQNGYGSWLLTGNLFSVDSKYNTDNMTNWISWIPRLNSLPQLALASYEPADSAFLSVCAGAGATLPRVDEIDRRLLDEAAGIVDPRFYGALSDSTPERGVGIINSPRDIVLQHPDSFYVDTVLCTEYPYMGLLPGESMIVDTDRDGMPDAWETAHGLNPNSAADGNLCTLSSLVGYTNLEYYLNGGDGEMASPLAVYDAPAPRCPATYLRQISEQQRAVKRLVNGVLYIETGNQRYSATGVRL